MNPEYQIRRRTKEDCKELAHLITLVWNETYPGIVPESFLKGLYESEEKRAEHSYETFDEEDNHQFVLTSGNKIVGFVKVGEGEDASTGEIHAIYILKENQGKGYGKKLFQKGLEELKEMGYSRIMIGCLEGNPSNKFYQHMGGKMIKTRTFELLGLPENVYLFED